MIIKVSFYFFGITWCFISPVVLLVSSSIYFFGITWCFNEMKFGQKTQNEDQRSKKNNQRQQKTTTSKKQKQQQRKNIQKNKTIQKPKKMSNTDPAMKFDMTIYRVKCIISALPFLLTCILCNFYSLLSY
jgi:flagellar biosynthesis component FlhA